MTEIRHGTYAGWNQHQRQRVPTCDACRAAQRDYVASRRNRGVSTDWTGCTPGLGWPRARYSPPVTLGDAPS